MPIIRRLISQSEGDVDLLKVDISKRYIINSVPDWQSIFLPKFILTPSAKDIKIAAQLDTNTFNSIKVIAYLYNKENGTTQNAASIVFNIYRISAPDWTEIFIRTESGIPIANNYFYKFINISDLIGTSLDGDTTLMIEAIIVRGSNTYYDRIYVNHIGVYDSIIRLKQDVDFLDITKLDE